MINKMSPVTPVFHSIGSISRVHGGTAVFAAELVNSLANIPGAHIGLAAPARADSLHIDERVTIYWGRDGFKDNMAWLRPRQGVYAKALGDWVNAQPSSVVHQHGLWMRMGYEVTCAARANGRPLILSPHGMMEPWSLAYKANKKRIALAMYQKRELDRVTVFHSTAKEELDGIRQFGIKQPCAVIPIGVALPAMVTKPHSEVRTALFLSRIHPKKGIIELLRSWSRVSPKNWTLVLAGNDDGGHLAEVESEIRRLNLGSSVEYVGAAFGESKQTLLGSADVFLLPSYSENFGIVVIEALANGVPVMTTTATPWRLLEREGCGWCIDVGQAALDDALDGILQTPPAKLRSMGVLGRRLVERDYQWERVAAQFMGVYNWINLGGVKPDCVYL